MTSSGDFPDPTAAEPWASPEIAAPSETPPVTETTGATEGQAQPQDPPQPPATADAPGPGTPAVETEPLPSQAPGAVNGPGTVEETAAPSASADGINLDPQLAAIVEIPAQSETSSDSDGEGGEWDLLVSQVREWLQSLQLQQTFQELRRPLSLVGWLLALVVVLRIYAAVLGTLDHLPLVPRLLQLVGVIVVIRFSLRNLVRSQQRQQLLQSLGDRWKAFRG